jgi:excisionase family DNA binding protein
MQEDRNYSLPTEWFTVEESATYLRVSKRTIYKWTKEGKLPAYIIGNRRHRRYKKSDLDNLPRLFEINTIPRELITNNVGFNK